MSLITLGLGSNKIVSMGLGESIVILVQESDVEEAISWYARNRSQKQDEISRYVIQASLIRLKGIDVENEQKKIISSFLEGKHKTQLIDVSVNVLTDNHTILEANLKSIFQKPCNVNVEYLKKDIDKIKPIQKTPEAIFLGILKKDG